jgi:hypothetical protein
MLSTAWRVSIIGITRISDAIYVGPADLAFSLGKTPKLEFSAPARARRTPGMSGR